MTERDKKILGCLARLNGVETGAELGIDRKTVYRSIKRIKEETGLDPNDRKQLGELLSMAKYYKYGSQSVVCPFYIGHDRTTITCEGYEEGLKIHQVFKDKTSRDKVLNECCRSHSGCKGCVIYRMNSK